MALRKFEDRQVGERIKEIRKSKGLTQKQLGKILGLAQSAINDFEQGRIPHAMLLKQIANIGGATVDWLLSGKYGMFGVNCVVYEEVNNENVAEKQSGAEAREIQVVMVPILEDRISAGPARHTDFSKVEHWAPVPGWMIKPDHRYAISRVAGNCMVPMFGPETLVLINLSRGDPYQLKNRPVAAWLGQVEEATVKILQQDGSGRFWVLHACNPACECEDVIVPKDQKDFHVAAIEAAWLNFE